MSEARDQLLDRVIQHVATSGLSDTSLREIADAVGSSHRMLHYHFGGRDGLVAAIVAEVERRQRDLLAAIASDAATPADVLRAQWRGLTGPETRPFLCLFFEVLGLALHGRPGTESFLADLTDPWIDAAVDAQRRLGQRADRAAARLGVAVMRGLLIDVVATDDTRAATAAFERFVAMWDAANV